MRLIKLDTETSGMSFNNGGKIVEIGMVETINFVPTGRTWHRFLDPQCDIHWAAQRIHGLSRAKLTGQLLFADLADEMLDFIGDAQVWAHNAKFDRDFVNGELRSSGRAVIPTGQWKCTIEVFRQHIRPASFKLDQVVSHLQLPVPDRKLHGALLDAAILAGAVGRVKGVPDFDIGALVEAGLDRSVTPGSGGPARQAKPQTNAGQVQRPGTQSTGIHLNGASGQPDATLHSDLKDRIDEVNLQDPKISAELYTSMRSGRDYWTGASANEIHVTAMTPIVQDTDLLQAIASFGNAQRLTCLRWICRGLDPVHALCLQIVRDTEYDRPVPDQAREFVLARTHRETGPEL